MTKHEQNTIKFYAHDYRDMAMNEIDLTDLLKGFLDSLMCRHECTSNCRRKGCNCNCGEYHF